MANLPSEITEDILPRLPVKSLLRFWCVNKHWYSLITEPKLVQTHLDRANKNNNFSLMVVSQQSLYYQQDHDKTSVRDAVRLDHPFKSETVKVVGSCDGLLCLQHDDSVCIWNPSTGEFRKLPPLPIVFPERPNRFPHSQGPPCYRYGFGYDETIHDYKVVRIVFFLYCNGESKANLTEVKVYTLGTNKWKTILNAPYSIFTTNLGALVNGAVHWISRPYRSALSPKQSINAFNFVDEKFNQILLSIPLLQTGFYCSGIGVLGGRLCIQMHRYSVASNIWVMKDYGVEDSWTRLFTIPEPDVNSLRYMRPLCFTKTGEVLLEDGKCYAVYDQKHRTCSKVYVWENRIRTQTYVGSLVSLKSGTYVQENRSRETNTKSKQMSKRRKMY